MGGDWFDVNEVRELVPGIGVPARRAVEDASQRLQALGPAALSDAELLCVLGVTTTEADVKPLLAQGLPHLLEAPELAFEVAPQLATRLFAALELGRRLPIRRGERSLAAFEALDKPDYSPLLRPSFWLTGGAVAPDAPPDTAVAGK
jgi:hypothetical protein